MDKGDILMINAKSRLLLFMLLIGFYLLAFMLNFMPAIKHPDLYVSILALFSSILLALLLLIYSTSGGKKIRIFSLVGILSGVLIYIIDHFTMELFLAYQFILKRNECLTFSVSLYCCFTFSEKKFAERVLNK